MNVIRLLVEVTDAERRMGQRLGERVGYRLGTWYCDTRLGRWHVRRTALKVLARHGGDARAALEEIEQAECRHEWTEEAGYRFCVHCGLGGKE